MTTENNQDNTQEEILKKCKWCNKKKSLNNFDKKGTVNGNQQYSFICKICVIDKNKKTYINRNKQCNKCNGFKLLIEDLKDNTYKLICPSCRFHVIEKNFNPNYTEPKKIKKCDINKLCNALSEDLIKLITD